MTDHANAQTPSLDRLIEWLKTQRAKKPNASLRELLGRATVTPQQLIDLACVDLMQRRREGIAAVVEDYTQQFPQLTQEAPLLDLIDAEICVAVELNQTPDETEYAKRFPKQAKSIAQLIQLPPNQLPPNAWSNRSWSNRSWSDRSWSNRSEQPPKKRQLDQPPEEEIDELPDRLGGYRILRVLGHGAMGEVYEARQVSLDRLVALKTIRNRILHHPATLARFTREAYSAAQLTHHNIVQIYDFGEDKGRYFFSMERVAGGTLAELVQRKKRLDPKLAAGYALQAARGLQFAHGHGMVHRDVKPANLLLSEAGVVKVADLGLVKLPDLLSEPKNTGDPSSITSAMASGTEVTMQGTAVGTPAFMAPEQSLDAAAVDHRADVYSLGCTLFFLLTGLPPFEGTEAADVMKQHAAANPPSLRELNRRVPENLNRIVARAMAKRPQDRYASTAEMISDLEAYLGIASESGFTPSADQADQWEKISANFNVQSFPQRIVQRILPALVVLSLSLLLTTAWFAPSWWLLSPSFLTTAIVTALLLDDRRGGHPLVVSVRRWMTSLHWSDWSLGLVASAVMILVILLTGGTIGLVIGVTGGGLLGTLFHFAAVRPAHESQSKPLAIAERFIRNLRILGADEEGIQRMVARYSGTRWQPLFESLFGYQELGMMREQVQRDPSFPVSTSSLSIADMLCAKFDARTEANRIRRDQRRLFKIERRGLQCQGIGTDEAREQAWQIAAAVVAEAKRPSQQDANAGIVAEAKRQRIKVMLADARSGKYRHPKIRSNPIKIVCGGQTRLVTGMILVAVFAIWGNQNGVFEPIQQLDAFSDLRSGQLDLEEVSSAFRNTAAATSNPEGVTNTHLLGSHPWSVGIAGLLLMLSAFVSGWRMTPPAIAASIIVLYGPNLGIPKLYQLTPWMVSAIVGIMIYVPGVIWGESPADSS
ncbi:MAG: serine/threonine-protein kinase [Rubripirellula sp.]|nr:serine/threonine-protein kinase [Rubripirellula sp.]